MSLALHPYQAEIAPRRAQHVICAVEHRDLRPAPGQAVSDGAADQATADHNDVGVAHQAAPWMQALQSVGPSRR